MKGSHYICQDDDKFIDVMIVSQRFFDLPLKHILWENFILRIFFKSHGFEYHTRFVFIFYIRYKIQAIFIYDLKMSNYLASLCLAH